MKVRALRELRFKTSKGEITVKPGQVFKPAEPEKLIHAGLVEPVILPPDQAGKPYWRRSDGSCYACGSTESWQSVYGVTICSRCHPPGHDGLVLQRYGNA